MKRYTVIAACVLYACFFNSCLEPEKWKESQDQIPPGPVTNVHVENLNGGARITYSLPGDKDLLGVKAIYAFTNGEVKESFSSAFKDTVLIQGYPDTEQRSVKLIVVDKSWNESPPVEVLIKPLTPSIELIRNTLNVSPSFGGLFVEWENPNGDEIVVSVFERDSIGDYQPYESHYTRQKAGGFAFRGFEALPQHVRLELRDRWNNYSRPLDTVITPLFEQEIVGRNEQGYIWNRWGWDNSTTVYRGDVSTTSGSQLFERVHDGDLFSANLYWSSTEAANMLSQFTTVPPNTLDHVLMPAYFTIDMGRSASYSRMRYWMRARNPIFSGPIFTSFEIWGSNHPKALHEVGDGSKEANLQYWTQWPEVGGTDAWKQDWVKILDAEVKLPSGQTDPVTLTAEDRDFVAAGFEFEIEPQFANQNFRYLRFVVRKGNWPNQAFFQVSQLKFWGVYAD